MPRKKLTKEGVRKINPPPKGKQIDYYDAVMPGLVLRVNDGGRKTWRALHYIKGSHKRTGKPRTELRTHPLGKYPIINLKAAREAAQKFLLDPQKALAGGTGVAARGAHMDAAPEGAPLQRTAGRSHLDERLEQMRETTSSPRWINARLLLLLTRRHRDLARRH